MIVSAGAATPRAPTDLDYREMRSRQGGWKWETVIAHGLLQTAEVTSASLTEVINITGSGVINVMGLIRSNNAVSTPKIKVVIDGVTVADETGTTFADDKDAYMVVGALHAGVDSADTEPDGLNVTFGNIIFNKSLVVSIAADGGQPVEVIWSRYLT